MLGPTMRIFICVSPDSEAGAAIGGYLAALAPLPGFKWVAPENAHITLAFVGDVDAIGTSRLDSELSQIGGVRPFRVVVSGVGGFPNVDAPRLIFVDIKEGARELAKLAKSVSRSVERSGLESDGRPFRPHMTIARAKGDPSPTTPEVRAALADAPTIEWSCSSFTMMRSDLTPKGPIYTPIRHYEL